MKQLLMVALLAAGVTTMSRAQDQTVNGDLYIGAGSHDQVGYGKHLYFIGNSDNCYVTRFNVAPNQTEFRISIGDDNEAYDKFAIGITDGNGQYQAKMVVQGDGKVGIGTNNPESKLHLLSVGSSVNATSSYTGDMIIQSNSADRSINSGASLEFVIPANTDGTNPWGQARIITVSGNANSYDATGKLILGTRRMFDKGVGTGMTWNYGDDLVIDGTGKIGIGTSVPDAKLAVKGTIHTQEVKVDMNGWADYVFKPSYRLQPLSDVKAYIDKNHHLPEVPSEIEAIKEGVNLGEMNKLLLKKVEELTLYLIEKDEQLKQQQNEINSIKRKILFK